MVYAALCFSQLAHILAIRSERESLFREGLLSNRPPLAAVSLRRPRSTCRFSIASSGRIL